MNRAPRIDVCSSRAPLATKPATFQKSSWPSNPHSAVNKVRMPDSDPLRCNAANDGYGYEWGGRCFGITLALGVAMLAGCDAAAPSSLPTVPTVEDLAPSSLRRADIRR